MQETGHGELDEFTLGYIYSALWEKNDLLKKDKNYEISDIGIESLDNILSDCHKFQKNNKLLLDAFYAFPRGEDKGKFIPEHAGYDFWLARNRKPTEFWTQLDISLAHKLIKAAQNEREQIISEVNGKLKFSCPT